MSITSTSTSTILALQARIKAVSDLLNAD